MTTTVTVAQSQSEMKPTESLTMNTEAVADSLYVMIQRELCPHSSCSSVGYLDPSDPTMITADDREKLVNWCYGLVDFCDFSRESVASAMEMVDRFLSISMLSTNHSAARERDKILRDRSKFQLLIIAAVYCSIKINERIAVSSDVLSDMCSCRYTVKEIEDMEHKLLCGLSWRCYAPTAQQVGYSILSLILPHVDVPEVKWSFILDEMTYLIELAVQDYYFSSQRRSTVALAAIFNVMSDTRTKEYQQPFEAFLSVIMECFELDQSADQIDAARRRLRSISDSNNEGDSTATVDEDDGLSYSARTIRISNKSLFHPKTRGNVRSGEVGGGGLIKHSFYNFSC